LFLSAIVLLGLTVIGAGTAASTMELSKQAVCMSNLRVLSEALRQYFDRYKTYPKDGPHADWRSELAPFIGNRFAFVCPCCANPEVNSYQNFYIRRPPLAGNIKTGDFVLGCLRHRRGRKATNLFTGGEVKVAKVGRGQWTGGAFEYPDELRGGSVLFEDGTKVTLGGHHRARVILSFQQPQGGPFYSLVRVAENSFGTLKAEVPEGSRLDVLTPTAVVLSRGTRFDVTSADDGTLKISVESGLVKVQSYDGSSVLLSGNDSLVVASAASAPRYHPFGRQFPATRFQAYGEASPPLPVVGAPSN